MKFGTKYQDALKKEEFPSQWINSALSYKKLKKCIKRVREELLSLGLDNETLEALWQHVRSGASYDRNDADDQRMMHYQFTTDQEEHFVPKLTIALDPRDGSPMDAWLSPETRRFLQKVGKHRQQRRLSSRRPSTQIDVSQVLPTGSSTSTSVKSWSADTSPEREELSQDNRNGSQINGDNISTSLEPGAEHEDNADEEIETVEIPLTSDSEFFQLLRKELRALEKLQRNEKQHLETNISSLSDDLRLVKSSKSKSAKRELSIWREIFRLYIESEIFLSNHELDAGARDADKAAAQFNTFIKQLNHIDTNPPKPKSKEAHIALDRFLTINITLLNLLKFQELNRRALSKILKKFEKQTSLHAISPNTPSSQILQTITADGTKSTSLISPHDLARSTAYTISEALLSLIPQLDDYLCPICSYISYKPIRLRCNHVFCIRCMIKMQRDDKDECPLCRERVVLEATGEHLDVKLKKFLKSEFPGDVDEKRRVNELEAGKEMFGEQYEGTHKCVVM